jgi:dipeptidyl aminopeptidase/acylaminoacyl peptidase
MNYLIILFEAKVKSYAKVVLFFSLIAFCCSLDAQRNMTAEDLWSFERVSLDDLSADGKFALAGVSLIDIEANSGTRKLYLINTETGENTLFDQIQGSASNARFLPGSSKIGFLSGGRMWEIPMEGGEPNPVSELNMGGFSYAPTGDQLLYHAEVVYNQQITGRYQDLPKANARIIDNLMYRHWDTWYDGTHRNIFVASYSNGQLTADPQNIINGPYDSPLKPFGGMNQITWSPDGRYVAYTTKKLTGKAYTQSTNSDIYLYDVQTGETRNLSVGMMGYDKEPAFSPDGLFIAWNSMERDGYESDRNRIFIMELASGEKREITAGFDQNASHPAWNKDGSHVYFTSEVGATIHIFSIQLADGSLTQWTNGVYNFNEFKIGDGFLIASRNSMSAPAELYRISLSDKSVTPLTDFNKKMLSQIKMGKVEQKMVKTTDNKDMLVWYIYPPDFDPEKKYPTLLYCQGGPQSAVSQFFSYRWNFQMMAAQGYIVVAPNRRGLPSFGNEWNEQISGDWGGQAMDDLLSAIDDAATLPYVDETRLGAVGASFGGYSVYWLAGNHEGRFKSFISHCGLFHLETWYGMTEEMFFANWDVGGSYWEEEVPVSYHKHSPHLYVRNWDTPILVIHGEKDFRVPVAEGMQAFQVAQLKEIKSRFLYFPEEGHWVLQPQNGILWQREFFRWLSETL